MTPFQLEASTKAPWTSTTVGVKPTGVVSGVLMRISSPVKWNRLGIVRPACHPAARMLAASACWSALSMAGNGAFGWSNRYGSSVPCVAKPSPGPTMFSGALSSLNW